MPKVRAVAVAAAAAALALLGAACSSEEETPSGPPPATPDPCALVTLEEVATAFGETFTVSEELPEGGLPGQRTCAFQPEADSVSQVSVAVWPTTAEQVDALKAESGEVADIEGIGRVAFGEPRAVWAFDGTFVVNITVNFVDVPSTDPATSLARTAIDRLP